MKQPVAHPPDAVAKHRLDEIRGIHAGTFSGSRTGSCGAGGAGISVGCFSGSTMIGTDGPSSPALTLRLPLAFSGL
jgi:hypothetical protein